MIDIILYSIIGGFIGHLLFKVDKLKEEIFQLKGEQMNLERNLKTNTDSYLEQVALNKSLQKQLDKSKRGF